MFLAAEGYCRCGLELEKGWHADHVVAFAAGGETDVFNGEALCPKCNQRKGGKGMDLREWQGRFLRHFSEFMEKQRDYLLVATPGSGKTTGATHASLRLLNSRIAERIVVVVPTESLKNQWAKAAHKCARLSLNPDWAGDAPEGRDFRGVVVTYHSLSSASQRSMHAQLCRRRRTAVIFDEIHHLGEGAWGVGAQQAFGHAAFRLGLSGTPFRSDGVRIPFVRYEPHQDVEGAVECIADFSYSYMDAMRARPQVCRFVYFPRREGEAHWIGRKGEQRAAISEQISKDLDSERLRAILEPSGEYIRTLFQQADEKLTECRATGHRNAGGLIIASDVYAAERYMRVIESITGEKAMLVVSNHEEATSIDAFRGSTCRWLVAVRMVSEGVDIDRLRTLVYATDYRTELYFRQAVGRVVRMTDGITNQPAYVFIPDDKQLREWATNIENEVNQILREREREPKTGGNPNGGSLSNGVFHVLNTSAATDAGTIAPGVTYTPEEIAEARTLRSEFGISEAHEEQIAHMLRAHDNRKGTESTPGPVLAEDEPPHVKLARLRRECSKLANRLDKILEREPGETHAEWRRQGGMPQGGASIDDLEKKKKWLVQRVAQFADGSGDE